MDNSDGDSYEDECAFGPDLADMSIFGNQEEHVCVIKPPEPKTTVQGRVSTYP
jgi:hypothetical protein